MDQTTLTTTLRELAADVGLHPAPASDARRRAARLQRRRRTGAVGLAAVVVLGAFGVTKLDTSSTASAGEPGVPQWNVELDDQTRNPNYATSEAVQVDSGGHRIALYWQGTHLCNIPILADGSGPRSGCSRQEQGPPEPLETYTGNDEGWTLIAVDAKVAHVVAITADGSNTALTPVSATGFPYRVTAVRGPYVRIEALDADGQRTGSPVIGSEGLQVRQVTQVISCTDAAIQVPVYPDVAGKSCYLLNDPAMEVAPASTQALRDPALGWAIQVDLTPEDTATFGALTQRVTTLPAPMNQLAFVLNGKVLNAPTIQAAITGGVFQLFAGTDPAWTQAYAEQLAAQLRG